MATTESNGSSPDTDSDVASGIYVKPGECSCDHDDSIAMFWNWEDEEGRPDCWCVYCQKPIGIGWMDYAFVKDDMVAQCLQWFLGLGKLPATTCVVDEDVLRFKCATCAGFVYTPKNVREMARIEL